MFVWAAGNGGEYFDSCAADGYVQSIYAIPVGAANQNGEPASYDEMCSAKMTVAYVENTNTLDPDVQVVSSYNYIMLLVLMFKSSMSEFSFKFLLDEC